MTVNVKVLLIATVQTAAHDFNPLFWIYVQLHVSCHIKCKQ